MQCLNYPLLYQDAYPPKITNEKKSDHNFLYPSDKQKCTCENHRSFSKCFLDGHACIPHILLLDSHFQAIKEAIY